MKTKLFITLVTISLLAFIALSQIKMKAFTPAEDFPREALIYVQVTDLPAFIKLWNKSKVREKYAASDNYRDFQNNHLGLKLAGRWQEFNDAAGFPIDLATVAQMAENQAAIAVYDIGKMEFVFVAPVSEQIFAATKFAVGKDKFVEETLADGTSIYRAKVEADRGRQPQELIFTSVKGRFILATSGKLLMQTLNNINGGATKNRLADEPSFKILSERIEPHTAIVWVDQARLNADYYFKHYWLMSEPKELKNIRAGIFDFQIQTGKLIENRRFLLNEPIVAAPFSPEQANEMLAFLPEHAPFYKLQKANPSANDEAVRQTIFEETGEKNNSEETDYSAPREGYTSGGFDILGDKFDEKIDETDDAETVRKTAANSDFSEFLQSAEPRTVLTFTQPRNLPAPRFVEFRRAAIFSFAAPQKFNRAAFETAVERRVAAQVLIAAPDAHLNWKSKSENNLSWRALDLPMLGRTIAYTLRGDDLIVTNDADFLREIASNAEIKAVESYGKSFSKLTVVNFDRRETHYDRIFNQLNRQNETNTFFTGNISSLLDSISDVKRIEIRKDYAGNIFEEELIFVTG